MLFLNGDQFQAWKELMQAIDDAPTTTACQNYPEAFFPERIGADANTMARQAKSLCKDCPVLTQCAAYAVQYEHDGIWGGLSPLERKRIRRKLDIRVPYRVSYEPED